ncbi:MAG: Xaa-Pro peptidase family protein [Endomicrobiia bacterium]
MDSSKIRFIQRTLSEKEFFLVFDKSDIFYLIGKELDGINLLIAKHGKPYFLVSPMLEGQVRQFFKKANVIVGNNLLLQLKSVVPKGRKILVQKNLSLSLFRLLLKKYSVETNDLLSELRKIKTESEIKKIKLASKITTKVLSEVVREIKIGMTEQEVKKNILKKFLDYDVVPSFDPIVAFDENTAYPHHISGKKEFGIKSFVLIDLGCKVNGYCSDITRMFFVEKNDVVNYYYKKLFELQKKLISMCVVGKKVADIDTFAKKFCKDLNIEKNYLHTSGHGVGIEIHESPRISVKDKTILKSGMVITIEPGIYFAGQLASGMKQFVVKKFGLRIEDVVLITKNGPQILSR